MVVVLDLENDEDADKSDEEYYTSDSWNEEDDKKKKLTPSERDECRRIVKEELQNLLENLQKTHNENEECKNFLNGNFLKNLFYFDEF